MDERFETFGAQHTWALVIFAVGAVVFILLGRAVRGSDRDAWVGRALAVAIVAFTVPSQILQLMPAEWNLRTSLPLQLCDLAWIVAVHALWTRSRLTVTITFLWGVTLTTQAMLTPDLATPWPEPRFMMFWGKHWLVVWAAFFLVPGVRILPTWRTYAQTIVVTFVWAVSVFVFNVFADTNYGYLNAKPSGASALDLLPPWPWYLPVEVAIIAAVWALLVWPCVRAGPKESAGPGVAEV